MRVLIVGEGKHEGAGALEAIGRRVLGEEHQYDFRTVRDPAFRATHGIGPNLTKKALACMRWAQNNGYGAVILVIDGDGDADRVRQFAAAQDSDLFPIPRALGVAIITFDAWMLADERAVSTTLGCVLQQLGHLEEISDAKERFASHLKASGCGLAQAEAYAAIARAMHLDQVAQRCPRGFGVFLKALRAIAV